MFIKVARAASEGMQTRKKLKYIKTSETKIFKLKVSTKGSTKTKKYFISWATYRGTVKYQYELLIPLVKLYLKIGSEPNKKP